MTPRKERSASDINSILDLPDADLMNGSGEELNWHYKKETGKNSNLKEVSVFVHFKLHSENQIAPLIGDLKKFIKEATYGK